MIMAAEYAPGMHAIHTPDWAYAQPEGWEYWTQEVIIKSVVTLVDGDEIIYAHSFYYPELIMTDRSELSDPWEV